MGASLPLPLPLPLPPASPAPPPPPPPPPAPTPSPSPSPASLPPPPSMLTPHLLPLTRTHALCVHVGTCVCRPGAAAGYLDLTLSQLVMQALLALEAHRGSLKHPGLSLPDTARAFTALFLTAHNPASEPHIRQRQHARLAAFIAECELAQQIAAVPRGSGARAVRQSPRRPELDVAAVKQLGRQYDALAREPREALFQRLFRPTPPVSK
jgi:hypothetical protein